MWLPYSDQVGPLVQTAKNVAVLVGAFSLVATVTLGVLLSLILLSLFLLLITVNPDLEAERRVIVTPVMRTMTRWMVGRPRAAAPGVRTRAEPAGHRRGYKEGRD